MQTWNKITKFIAHPIVQLLGLSGVFAVINWITAKLAELPIWVIWWGFVFSVVFAFLILNQLGIWQERHKKGFSSLTDEKMESILRKWLDRREYSTTHKSDEKFLFCFFLLDKQNRPINVLRPKDCPSVIRLLWMINEKDFEDIPSPNQELFRFNIAIEMARFGLLCHPGKPLHVHLDLPCDDSLTENIFFSGLDRIRQAHVLLSAHMRMTVLVSMQQQAKTLTNVQDSDKADFQI